jgi:hypothetical protein
VKTFRLSQYMILSLSIDIPRAAARCRDNHSKIARVAVRTELADLIDAHAYPLRMARLAPLD